MISIAKFDGLTKRQAEVWNQHPAILLWKQPQTGWIERIQHVLVTRQSHPARTVILLPYAHLLPLATRLWQQAGFDGFAPRFETTENWSQQTGDFSPAITDIAFNTALDTLNARDMLCRIGLEKQQDELAEMLVELAQQLAPLAAAVPPAQRAHWQQEAHAAVEIGMDNAAMKLEIQLAHTAIVWAAQSGYASDVVFSPQSLESVDCLIAVQGLTPDPLWSGLQRVWGERFVLLDTLDSNASSDWSGHWHCAPNRIAWHACLDAEDEAQRTTACALQHIAENRLPIALISSDRALTRRVRSMLESAGVQIRDETGWKLSTSHAGAHLMALLRAAQWSASHDDLLAWLKVAPTFAASVNALEAVLRKGESPLDLESYTEAQKIRSTLQGRHTLLHWLLLLQNALQSSGMWDALMPDTVGQQVLAALRLTPPVADARVPLWDEWIDEALWKTRPMEQSSFIRWVNQTLEGANFRPTYPDKEQVVILPMSQMLARPFAAVVLAGCDEIRLPPAPEPVGNWTKNQREAFKLPSRQAVQASHQAAWLHALQTPFADVLWRVSDDSGETLLPSSLVQRVQLARHNIDLNFNFNFNFNLALAPDPRTTQTLHSQPVKEPQARGNELPVKTLSASSYGDLRACPYRFFALRQLGLRGIEEIETVVDKRDFGLWLHKVLERFHCAQKLDFLSLSEENARRDRLNTISTSVTEDMRLTEGEFLPFAASWSAVRDGYLKWLREHEAIGATFLIAEDARSISVSGNSSFFPMELTGRIDRTDTTANGTPWVMDYKTESVVKTKERIAEPLEDTQMAFYAALLKDEILHAAYINIGEREGTHTYCQPAILTVRDALLAGIQTDMGAIAQGQPLIALGDGAACDYCQVRGLCRRDFWK